MSSGKILKDLVNYFRTVTVGQLAEGQPEEGQYEHCCCRPALGQQQVPAGVPRRSSLSPLIVLASAHLGHLEVADLPVAGDDLDELDLGQVLNDLVHQQSET